MFPSLDAQAQDLFCQVSEGTWPPVFPARIKAQLSRTFKKSVGEWSK
jgi:hypothetical protein